MYSVILDKDVELPFQEFQKFWKPFVFIFKVLFIIRDCQNANRRKNPQCVKKLLLEGFRKKSSPLALIFLRNAFYIVWKAIWIKIFLFPSKNWKKSIFSYSPPAHAHRIGQDERRQNRCTIVVRPEVISAHAPWARKLIMETETEMPTIFSPSVIFLKKIQVSLIWHYIQFYQNESPNGPISWHKTIQSDTRIVCIKWKKYFYSYISLNCQFAKSNIFFGNSEHRDRNGGRKKVRTTPD